MLYSRLAAFPEAHLDWACFMDCSRNPSTNAKARTIISNPAYLNSIDTISWRARSPQRSRVIRPMCCYRYFQVVIELWRSVGRVRGGIRVEQPAAIPTYSLHL